MISPEVRKKHWSSGQQCTAKAALQIQCLLFEAHDPRSLANSLVGFSSMEMCLEKDRSLRISIIIDK